MVCLQIIIVIYQIIIRFYEMMIDVLYILQVKEIKDILFFKRQVRIDCGFFVIFF